MEPWWHVVVWLIVEKREDLAIETTRRAAAAGSLGAMVRLACFGPDAGISFDEADAVIDAASAEVAENDATAHWLLSGAYDLRLGLCSYEKKSIRMLHHLQCFVCASGSPFGALAVARCWASGSAAVEPDVSEAVDWYYIADALGSPEALGEARAVLRRVNKKNTAWVMGMASNPSIERTPSSRLRRLAVAAHVER